MPVLQDIQDAQKRISPFLLQTPSVLSAALSERLEAKVYLKLETMQRTGSFKERGALNRLLLLDDEQKQKGVVTASAGNHAQGVAYHATRLGIRATVFMPQHAPIVKITQTEGYGATVTLVGENFDDAHAAAKQFSKERGSFYLHAFDDDAVIAGQGTIGLELILEVPSIDVVIVPVGGGGLMAGVSTAIKSQHPNIRLIGIEPEALPSIADGLATRCVSRKAKEWFCVNDDEIARAILFLIEKQKIVTEGAGAAGVAALLANKIKELKGKTIVVVVGGGNIDVHLISRVIERGMVESGRLVRLRVTVFDRPGALGALLEAVGRSAANVMAIRHERAFVHTSWDHVQVDLVLETRDRMHIEQVVSMLHHKGFTVWVE